LTDGGSLVDFFDQLGCEVQTAATARHLAEMTIDFGRGMKALSGRFADIAVSMTVA
jgi:hypothetical protein